MMSTRERVVTTLADLTETQMQEVADFLEFLKFRERQKHDSQLDDATLEALYAEFAEEDRELSEAGLGQHVANLELEDAAS
jgi:ABC-type phosphate transport system auxiliary subunit